MFDVNFPKFLNLMRHVVLHDIENYYLYYAGLGIKTPEEDERDENIDAAKI
jgi:hypothetical protein